MIWLEQFKFTGSSVNNFFRPISFVFSFWFLELSLNVFTEETFVWVFFCNNNKNTHFCWVLGNMQVLIFKPWRISIPWIVGAAGPVLNYQDVPHTDICIDAYQTFEGVDYNQGSEKIEDCYDLSLLVLAGLSMYSSPSGVWTARLPGALWHRYKYVFKAIFIRFGDLQLLSQICLMSPYTLITSLCMETSPTGKEFRAEAQQWGGRRGLTIWFV